MINAAVLTISDSVSAGTREDRSGPAVRERLEVLGWRVALMEVIPDTVSEISERLATLADGGQVSAIFTTGGTGVAARDVTPEATRAILDREIPGLGELMRRKGAESTPLAVLSRSLGGTRGRVLIVNLPGRPSSIRVCLDAVFPAIPYCVDLIGGPRIDTDPVRCQAFRPNG